MSAFLDTAMNSFAGLLVAFVCSVAPGSLAAWLPDFQLPSACTHGIDVDTGETSTQFFLEMAWDTDNICAATDWVILFWLYGMVYGFSWGIRWAVFEPFYRFHFRAKPSTGSIENVKEMQNFSQTCSACLFHVLSAYFSYQILSPKSWLYEQEQWFKTDSVVSQDLKFYFLLYATRYMSDVVSLFHEHPRSDTPAYAIHHVVTVVLVLISAHTNYIKAGGLIMFCMDWADPFMLAAKACKYLSSDRSDVYQFLSDRLFELFAIAFVGTRNILFTYVVYVALVADDSGNGDAGTRLILKALLGVLVILMTYWLGLILQAYAYQRFENKGNINDIREEGVLHEPARLLQPRMKFPGSAKTGNNQKDKIS